MILLILLIAFLIRLIGINQSLWLDEAINVIYASNYSFLYFVTEYSIADFHPPGWFAILWIWVRVFGDSEISVRTPSLIFGILTVLVTYQIGKKLFSKQIGLIASLFLTIAPLHIYYSQEARMYSLAAFSAILSTYFFLWVIEKKKFATIFYGLSLALLLYSDYLTYLIIPAHLIYILFFQRELLKNIAKSYLISIFLFSPWLFFFPFQLINGIQTSQNLRGWSEVVGGFSVKQITLLFLKIIFGRVSIENNLFYFLGFLFASIPFLIALTNAVKNLNQKLILVIFCFIFPILGGLIISFFIPVFTYFRFVFILPFLYLFFSYGFFQLQKKIRIICIVLAVLFEVILSGTYLFNTNFHREDWKTAVKFIVSDDFSNSSVVFENDQVFAPFQYYYSKAGESNQKLIYGLKNIPAKSKEDIYDFSSTNEELLVFEYLTDITDPSSLLVKEIEKNGYKKGETFNFRGVGFIHQYVKD